MLLTYAFLVPTCPPAAVRGGEPGPEGSVEGVAPSPTRPGESPAAAGTDPQEGEAQEGRGRSGAADGQPSDSTRGQI